ncbi:hypothetical protein L210DRAFT_3630626 [Boletus edulis BED1]|uniref:Uncharacterized protein n=1 Tax=Boletus edulis BED1 TaxID=1328754 RepID=A0AAD4GEZ8_BOLED|nr:hypothetical protein L210DRAFT_3630626 [Boletus edulis BED1]
MAAWEIDSISKSLKELRSLDWETNWTTASNTCWNFVVDEPDLITQLDNRGNRGVWYTWNLESRHHLRPLEWENFDAGTQGLGTCVLLLHQVGFSGFRRATTRMPTDATRCIAPRRRQKVNPTSFRADSPERRYLSYTHTAGTHGPPTHGPFRGASAGNLIHKEPRRTHVRISVTSMAAKWEFSCMRVTLIGFGIGARPGHAPSGTLGKTSSIGFRPSTLETNRRKALGTDGLVDCLFQNPVVDSGNTGRRCNPNKVQRVKRASFGWCQVLVVKKRPSCFSTMIRDRKVASGKEPDDRPLGASHHYHCHLSSDSVHVVEMLQIQEQSRRAWVLSLIFLSFGATIRLALAPNLLLFLLFASFWDSVARTVDGIPYLLSRPDHG